MNIREVLDRQRELPLKVPRSVAVLGVGGIGSWVALFFAMSGVKEVVMVDPDIVEASNLNRTPFKVMHVGMPKVYALADLIIERREGFVDIVPFFSKETEEVLEALKKVDIIIDCRDGEKFFEDEELQKKVVAKLGYDGVSMTVVWHPEPGHGWGEDVRYTITSSYLVPPVFLAALIVDSILRGWVPERYEVRTWVEGLKEVVKGVEE